MQGIYSRVRVERVRGEITEASTGSRFDGWDRERYETHARNASCRLFGPLDPRLLRQAQLDSSQRRRPIGRRDFANRYHLPAAQMLKCHGHLPIWQAVHCIKKRFKVEQNTPQQTTADSQKLLAVECYSGRDNSHTAVQSSATRNSSSPAGKRKTSQ